MGYLYDYWTNYVRKEVKFIVPPLGWVPGQCSMLMNDKLWPC